MVRDAIQQDRFQLTHELISQMLGVRRSGVTVIAGSFQKAGIIRYNRGTIEIIDNRKLEATACECYRTISRQTSELMNIALEE